MDAQTYARDAIARSVAADAEMQASQQAFREGRFLDYITERAANARARLGGSSDGEPDTARRDSGEGSGDSAGIVSSSTHGGAGGSQTDVGG